MTTQLDTSRHSEEGNTKPPLRARKWCFTLNNYTETELISLTNTFNTTNTLFIIGEEMGEQGTPHLQGYVEFKNARNLKTLKNINNKIHWEKAKGSRDDNIRYCKKEGKVHRNIPQMKEEVENSLLEKMNERELYPWQKDLIEIIKEEPNDRTIHWIYDNGGNIGKSWLCKYIYLKFGCVIADGKKDNVFNQIKTNIDEGLYPKVILLDIPRHNKDYVNYGCLEAVKNGLIYSGKYEGGVCSFDNPHLFVFANHLPDYDKFSQDRWRVCEIKNANDSIKWYRNIIG